MKSWMVVYLVRFVKSTPVEKQAVIKAATLKRAVEIAEMRIVEPYHRGSDAKVMITSVSLIEGKS